jgi:hypothetical protein
MFNLEASVSIMPSLFDSFTGILRYLTQFQVIAVVTGLRAGQMKNRFPQGQEGIPLFVFFRDQLWYPPSGYRRYSRE